MDAIASANIAFSVAGLFMLAVVFWQAMVGGQTRKQVVFLVGAAFLHAGALACWIGADIPKLYGAIGVPPLLAWLAFGLDACSALHAASVEQMRASVRSETRGQTHRDESGLPPTNSANPL